MKKIVSVFLLLVFQFNMVGVVCLFSFLQHKNYENIFSPEQKETNLVHLIIPKAEMMYWKNENEIIYKGKCYDVFQQSEDGKNYSLICYADSKEDLLNEALNKHVNAHQKQNTPQKNSNGHFSVKIFIQDFILNSSPNGFSINSMKKSSLQVSFSIRSGFISVFYPPPDFMVS